MTPQSQTDISASLLESQQRFNASLKNISNADAVREPAEGGWSVLGIVEHLTITESNLPRFFAMGLKEPGATRDPAREEALKTQVVARASKVQAPERIHPAGKFTTVQEALAAFNEVREGTIRFAVEHENELDTTMVTHPLFGPVSMRQLLVLAAGHSTRHLAQIEETLRAFRT